MYKTMFNKQSPTYLFEDALQQYSHQVFTKKDEDVNACLKEAGKDGSSLLTKEEAWLGLTGKAAKPEDFIPHAVRKSAIAHYRKTDYGGNFIRYSIQHSFISNKLVVVKEDIHIYEQEKRILFLGCNVMASEAKQFLGGEFTTEMLAENPPLFHVEHALEGSNENPIATWKMVRLNIKTMDDPEEAKNILAIRSLLENRPGTNIYLVTLEKMKDMSSSNQM